MPTKSLELLGRLGANESDAAAWLRASLERGLVDLAALPTGGAVTLGDPAFPRHREMPEPLASALAAAPEPAPAPQAPAAVPPSEKKPMKTVSPHDPGE